METGLRSPRPPGDVSAGADGTVARIAERIDDRPIRDAFASSAMGGVVDR
jgi:hypothetical protein